MYSLVILILLLFSYNTKTKVHLSKENYCKIHYKYTLTFLDGLSASAELPVQSGLIYVPFLELLERLGGQNAVESEWTVFK